MTPTLSDDAMLLRAICARPEDDAPRLVYADWLDEHGRHEQAEFVRVQIRIAAIGREKTDLLNDETDWSLCESESGLAASWCPNCGDCRCPDREERMDDPGCPLHAPGSNHCRADYLDRKADALRERERALLNQYGGDWHGIIPPPDVRLVGEQARDGVATVFFARGFPAHVALPVAALCGEPCETCSGTGIGASPDVAEYIEITGGCPTCHGTGHVAGIAAQLARLPLTSVRVVGREPLRFTPDHGSSSFDYPDQYAWGRQGRQSDSGLHWIQDDLWAMIECDDVRAERYKRFDTRETALDALSLAALALIRGLNPEAAPTKETDTCR